MAVTVCFAGVHEHCGVAAPASADTLETLAIGLGGAIVGALIALFGQAWFERAAAKRRVTNRLRALSFELQVIKTQAGERATPPAGGGVGPRGPLPTAAWTMLLSSADLNRVPEPVLNQLVRLYRLVDAANALAQEARAYLTIANLSPNAVVADAFDLEAREASSQPFRPIAAEIDGVIALVSGQVGADGA